MSKYWIFIIAMVLVICVVVLLPTTPSEALIESVFNEKQKYEPIFRSTQYAIIVDYEKPVFKKRLWVVDLKTKEVVLNTHVSHALKSGLIWANEFSNVVGSNTSCTGTFKTLNSYKSSFGKGKYQIGMRIKGLEKGINDHAHQRNIVFHTSYSLWSSGCFMTFPKTNKRIIDLTKDGSLLLVHK